MTDRNKERIGGLTIFLLSFTLYAFNWYRILNNSYYYPKTLGIGAALSVIGLALVVFPSYRRERIERGENIEELSGLRLLTTRWRVVLAVALAFAFGNMIYVEFFL